MTTIDINRPGTVWSPPPGTVLPVIPPATDWGAGWPITVRPQHRSTVVIYAQRTGYVDSSAANYPDARAGLGSVVPSAGTFPALSLYPSTSLYPSSAVADAAVLRVGQLFDGDYSCYETYADFDTSTIVGTIVTASLSLGIAADASAVDFTVEARLHDWGAEVDAADWVPGASLASKTLLATLASASLGPLASYQVMADVSAGSSTALRANINRTGPTRLLLSSDRHRLGSAPTGREYLAIRGSGDVLQPRLVVTTTP